MSQIDLPQWATPWWTSWAGRAVVARGVSTAHVMAAWDPKVVIKT